MKALIISLNFNPGHVSHLAASYRQFEEIGYKSELYVNPGFMDFLPEGLSCITTDNPLPECDVAVFLFPSVHNLLAIKKLKRSGASIIYIFHEPLAPLKHYRESGFSYPYLAKLWVADHVSALTVKWSDVILLPSHKAYDYYQSNNLYKNDNVCYLPLMYDDESTNMEDCTRSYISYIGTAAADHSFEEFLAFVQEALKNNWFPDKRFLIATKSEFIVPEALESSSRVCVTKGRPLSDEEINRAYASSAVVWNAYLRTTQSGVLAKAFMFGTPAIVMRHNLNEFMQEGLTVECIDDNKSCEEIHSKISLLLAHHEMYSANCRKFFLETFYYRKYNSEMKRIAASII